MQTNIQIFSFCVVFEVHSLSFFLCPLYCLSLRFVTSDYPFRYLQLFLITQKNDCFVDIGGIDDHHCLYFFPNIFWYAFQFHLKFPTYLGPSMKTLIVWIVVDVCIHKSRSCIMLKEISSVFDILLDVYCNRISVVRAVSHNLLPLYICTSCEDKIRTYIKQE